jgi:phospholipid/cholesterol/gamma-HCH transport system substrate-binding protein
MGTEVTALSQRAAATVDAVGADLQQFSAQTLPDLQRLLGELTVLSTSLRRLTEQTERYPAGLLLGGQKRPLGPGESTTGPSP